MAEEGLKISLIIDPGDSVQAANGVGAALGGIASDAGKANAALNNLAQGVNASRASMKIFETQAKSGQLVFTQYGQSAGKAVTSVKQLGAALPTLSRSLVNANGALIDISRIAQDAPFGFIAIQNNISPLVESFGRLSTASGGVGNALKAIGSSLAGPAGIALGISLVTSGVTVLVQKYGSLGNALQAIFGSLSEAEKAQASLNSVFEEAGKAAGSDIATLSLLKNSINDINTSQADRIKLINEYNKNADQSLRINKKDIDNLGQINSLISQQIQLIGQRAVAKAAENKLGEAAAKLLDVQLKNEPILAKGELPLDVSRYDVKITGKLRLPTPEEILKDTSLQANLKAGAQANATARAKALSFSVTSQYNNALREVQVAQDEFNKSLSAISQKVDIGGLLSPEKAPKAAKSIVTVSDVLADLDKQLLKTNALFVNSGDTLQRLTDDQIKNYQNALAGLIDINILPGDKVFDQLKNRLDDLQKIGTPLKVVIPLNPEFTLPPAVTNSIFGEDLLTTHFKPQVDAFTAKLNDLIQTSIEGGIGSISEALGAALVTGDFGSVIKAFVDSVAGFMQKLGISLIATGIGLEAFKESLKNLNGFAAVAAGAALVVAAGAFRAIASGGIGSFATGGTAYGTQLAVIGDNPERKEHVLSDNQLQKIADGGSSGGDWIGRFELDGQILSLAVERANRSSGRVN